jgi:hypothetical protein
MDNFYNDIKENTLKVFITFLIETNLSDLRYNDMVNVLKNKYNIENFIIIIFTTEQKKDFDVPEEIEIVTLDNAFIDDMGRKKEYRVNLYKEIYDKFSKVMNNYNIFYDSFENTFNIDRMPVLEGID